MEGTTMKDILRPLRALAALAVLAGLAFSGLACEGDGSVTVFDGSTYALASIENQSPDAIVVEPFGDYLQPGEAVDYDLGPDMVHIVIVRDFDGLILLETDLGAGDVWIVQ
jgi:hypothetical protein